MTKSELIDRIAGKQTQLSSKDVELAVKAILEYMSQVLSEGGRIEIRGLRQLLSALPGTPDWAQSQDGDASGPEWQVCSPL